MDEFYTIAYEAGAMHTPVAVFASKKDNPLNFASASTKEILKREIPEVPSAFQLLHVLSNEECDSLVEMADTLGFVEDSSITLPRNIRHNDNLVYLIDDSFQTLLFNRCKAFFTNNELYENTKALAFNKRFRFYRYKEGDYFNPHTDGACPGSAIVNGKLVHNAYKDRYSKMTFLLFLSDGYEGGATQFFINNRPINIHTPKGAVLCFAHGTHPLHVIHASTPITKGIKYIIRSDVLFEI